MIRKLLPGLLAIVGLAGGLGAGLLLRPAQDTPAAEDEASHSAASQEDHGNADATGSEYVKMNNQFVIPVLEGGRVSAMVVLSLSLDVSSGNSEAVYQREPRLRDAFLQVMFDHANVGGFSGSFTDGSNLVTLRESLKEAADMVLGPIVRRVLITDIARQDS